MVFFVAKEGRDGCSGSSRYVSICLASYQRLIDLIPVVVAADRTGSHD